MLALFDMDGLILDTEPLWGVAMQNVCDHYQLPLDSKIFRYTTGLRIDEVTAFWKKHLNWPTDLNSDTLANEIVDEIILLAIKQAKVLPGILPLLKTMKENAIPTAVVTSSPNRMLHKLMQHFQLEDYFNAFFSAQDVTYGKPHPDVYIKALHHFHSSPYDAIAFEDSVNGMIAARSAKIQTVVVPEPAKFNDKAFGLAEIKVRSMEEISLAQLKALIAPSLFNIKA